MDRAQANKLITQFANAVDGLGDLGAIPCFSSDSTEQRQINAERRRIKTNYTKAYNRLFKALTKENTQ